ncbi:MAG: hypothetical protein K2J76_08255 [Oscillospiraceae bacterium]|nr:hypothetical protein [Oscillospiraceae bacterium]
MNRKNMNLTAGTYNFEQDKNNKNNSSIVIPDNCKNDLIKAMKIGYYKEFYRQGLITAEQLELLIAMQDKSITSAA